MMRYPVCGLIAALLFAPSAPARLAATQPVHPSGDDVIAVARSFKDGGGYKWAGSGVCEEIQFDGKTVLSKSPEGTYCCGFTFNVAMKTAQQFDLLKGKTFEQVKQFQRSWYGVSSDKDIIERQPVRAMIDLGVGHAVKPDDSRPGDFLQFWRGKSGHSVVFLGWIEKEGRRIGFNYRSSQKATNGIGDHAEYLNDSGVEGGTVDPKRMYFARFDPVD